MIKDRKKNYEIRLAEAESAYSEGVRQLLLAAESGSSIRAQSHARIAGLHFAKSQALSALALAYKE